MEDIDHHVERPGQASGYLYPDATLNHSHLYLLPVVLRLLDQCDWGAGGGEKPVFDVGCGNGAVAAELAKRGYEVVGVDISEEGLAQAQRHYPHLRLEQGSAYGDLRERYGSFPVVLSLEVVEHLSWPRCFADTVYELLEPGGTAIISTPYHGYWKNLAVALANRFDAHVNPLADHGHIKFWSRRTLESLLHAAGFRQIEFLRVGRIPPLAKSMIAVAKR